MQKVHWTSERNLNDTKRIVQKPYNPPIKIASFWPLYDIFITFDNTINYFELT